MAEKQTNTEQPDLDYGHNKPTGGTNENTGKINPQGPTSGTENYHPDRKKNQQTTAPKDSAENDSLDCDE